jgi:hypothetical protein
VRRNSPAWSNTGRELTLALPLTVRRPDADEDLLTAVNEELAALEGVPVQLRTGIADRVL